MQHRFAKTLCLILLSTPALLSGADKKPKLGPDGYPAIRSQPTVAAESHLNLRYLPEWRYSGDKGMRRDYEMLLDLWVPEGHDNCPVVMYVHGGAYAAGSKSLNKDHVALADYVMERGFAFASLNYVLMPKGIRPQVWYDYRDAARFLRARAKEFRLDPTAFGAFGISAGGWLISTAGHGTGDHFNNDANGQGTTLYDLKHRSFAPFVRKEGDRLSVWTPLQNEKPAYPGIYGRWQAIAFDFKALDRFANSGSPAILDMVGDGVKLPEDKQPRFKPAYPPLPSYSQLAKSGIIDHNFAHMLAPKYKGKNVHVPPFLGKPGSSKKSQNEHALTRRVVGTGEAELYEVIGEWFVDRLRGGNARAPVPEIWPAMRIVDAPTEVSIVVPDGVTVHYTVDGSEPTLDSPTYSTPFTVEPDTIVKAIGTLPGRKPSGAAIASFYKGPVPPRLINTERELLPGQTGKPYSFTFTADTTPARFWLKGDLMPYVPRKQKTKVYPNGMRLDSETGVWSGTPMRPGRYWVQIALQRQAGTVARLHDFTWTVTGEALAADTGPTGKATDTNIALLHLLELAAKDRKSLERQADAAGIDLVIQTDDDVLILAPQEQKQQALALLKKHFGGTLPTGASWQD